MKKIIAILILVSLFSSVVFAEEMPSTTFSEVFTKALQEDIGLQIKTLQVELEEMLLEEVTEKRDKRSYFAGDRTDQLTQKREFYVDVLAAEHQLALAKEALKDHKASMYQKITNTYREIERVTAELDLEKSKLVVMQKEVNITKINVEVGLVKAFEQLSQEIGLSNQLITIRSLENELEGLHEDLLYYTSQDKQVDLPALEVVLMPDEEAMAKAKENDLAYLQALYAVEEKELDFSLVEEDFYDYEETYDVAQNALSKAELSLQEAENKLQQKMDGLHKQIAIAQMDIDIAKERITLQEELKRIQEVSYEVGEATALSLLQSEQTLKEKAYQLLTAEKAYYELLEEYGILTGQVDIDPSLMEY